MVRNLHCVLFRCYLRQMTDEQRKKKRLTSILIKENIVNIWTSASERTHTWIDKKKKKKRNKWHNRIQFEKWVKYATFYRPILQKYMATIEITNNEPSKKKQKKRALEKLQRISEKFPQWSDSNQWTEETFEMNKH